VSAAKAAAGNIIAAAVAAIAPLKRDRRVMPSAARQFSHMGGGSYEVS
jgi:hypothetical protein